MRFWIFCIILSISAASKGQEKEKQNAFFTVRGSVGIPKAVGSQMFRTSFKGTYEASLSANFRIFKNFTTGMGYLNNLFINNKNVFVYYTVPAGQKASGNTLSYDTRLSTNGGFIRLGYDRFFSDIAYFSCAINSGYLSSSYQKVIPDTSAANRPYASTNFNAPFVQPEFSLNFVTEKLLSFSILFSYTTVFYKFDPRAPRFNHVEQVRSRRNNYPMNWINIGFGFAVLID